MNRHIIRTIALITFVCFILMRGDSAILPQEARHIGKWEGTDDSGKTASIRFDKEGYAILFMDGETIGGKKEGAPSVKYEFNHSKTPVWLDLIIYAPTGKEIGRMRSIVKFLEADEMLWRISDDLSQRPTDFDEADKRNTILLKKVSR
ncbi:MAG: hypothetical protein L0229_10375 [Blastocatellia bacterium]|nr:hypothetical protein [Blastocatellia bacterium]